MITYLIEPCVGKLILNHLNGNNCPEFRNELRVWNFVSGQSLSNQCWVGNIGKLQKYQSLSNQSFKYNLSIWPPSWFFQKCIIWREGETLLFVTFNIIISHTFPEKIIYENSSCRSENIKISLSIWAIFTFFHRFFRFFDISLLQRN